MSHLWKPTQGEKLIDYRITHRYGTSLPWIVWRKDRKHGWQIVKFYRTEAEATEYAGTQAVLQAPTPSLESLLRGRT